MHFSSHHMHPLPLRCRPLTPRKTNKKKQKRNPQREEKKRKKRASHVGAFLLNRAAQVYQEGRSEIVKRVEKFAVTVTR